MWRMFWTNSVCIRAHNLWLAHPSLGWTRCPPDRSDTRPPPSQRWAEAWAILPTTGRLCACTVGATPLERVRLWGRRSELDLFAPALAVRKHTDPSWTGRTHQVAAIADMERARAHQSLSILDEALAQREFLAGDRFSIADILALCTVEFAAV